MEGVEGGRGRKGNGQPRPHSGSPRLPSCECRGAGGTSPGRRTGPGSTEKGPVGWRRERRAMRVQALFWPARQACFSPQAFSRLHSVDEGSGGPRRPHLLDLPQPQKRGAGSGRGSSQKKGKGRAGEHCALRVSRSKHNPRHTAPLDGRAPPPGVLHQRPPSARPRRTRPPRRYLLRWAGPQP